MTDEPRLRKIILGVVETQLRNNNPPETRETLERLVAEGHSREEALSLLGIVVACEIFDMMKLEQAFDSSRFVSRLRNLPELPDDKE
jgi:hypothetical protein